MGAAARSPLFKDLSLFTRADYQDLLQEQGGVCAICKEAPRGGRRLTTDHCHKNYRVRGLLCTRCNLGAGFLEEDSIRVEALRYLERAKRYEATPKHAVAIDVNDLFQKKIPKQDWRTCRDPHKQDLLLRSEIWAFQRAGMSEADTAEKLGVSLRRIRRILNGRIRAHFAELKPL